MLWEIEKNGQRSWIGGTPHFFCYGFERSFRELFEKVSTVLFEGPLDPASLDRLSAIGRTPDPESPRVVDALNEEDIRRLERVVCGPRGFWARLVGAENQNPPDVRHLLSGRQIKRNARAYLKGDLDRMFGTSIEFPTRTELVIHRRDARFLERIRPFIEEGRCAVFVGSAHMIDLPGMLAEAGFSVRRCR
jgi:uncharacterized protein YbaP (TraB family)